MQLGSHCGTEVADESLPRVETGENTDDSDCLPLQQIALELFGQGFVACGERLDLLRDLGQELGAGDVEDEADAREADHGDGHDRENEEVGDRGTELIAQTLSETLDRAHEVGRSGSVDGIVADLSDGVARGQYFGRCHVCAPSMRIRKVRSYSGLRCSFPH